MSHLNTPRLKTLDEMQRLTHAIKRQLFEQSEKIDPDLTPMHFRVIKVIERKNTCTANDIAHHLGRDKGQITRLINALTQKGYITRLANPNDKRSHYLKVTDNGKIIVAKIIDIETQTFQLMTQGLSDAEIEEFLRLSKHLADNLRAHIH